MRELRAGRARGFSLIEMLVVIAILGILAGVAIPFFIKIGRRQRIMTEAREVQSDLLAARMKAVKRNVSVSVIITPASGPENVHIFRVQEPPPPAPPGNIHDRNVSSSAFNVTPPAGNTITFRGDGRVSVPPNPTPGLIVIEGPPTFPTPNRVTIEADQGGKVRIITPTSWQ